MTYHYYEMSFKNPEPSTDESRKELRDYLEKLLSKANIDYLPSFESEHRFDGLLRSTLDMQEFNGKIREIFNLPEPFTIETLPKVSPTSWSQELAFSIPSHFKNHPNQLNFQTLFHNAYNSIEPLEVLELTTEEMQRVASDRFITGGKYIGAAIIYCGYAESARVTPLILYPTKGLSLTSPLAAIKNLAQDFLNKFQEEHDWAGKDYMIRDRSCCVATKQESSDYHFCNKCENIKSRCF